MLPLTQSLRGRCLAPGNRGEGCAERIVQELATARHTLLIEQYQLTAEPLIAGVIAAHRRGVAVRVLLDRRLSWLVAGLSRADWCIRRLRR